MQPFSYTYLKIVQDQKIKEALEHSRFSTGQETQKRGLLQNCGAFLARFTPFSTRKPQATSSFCGRDVEKRFPELRERASLMTSSR